MNRAARSVFLFGFYVVVMGAALVVAPQAMFRLLELPPSSDGFIRMIGLLALVIGYYDIAGGKSEALIYLRASVLVRFGFATGVALIVATGQMPPALLPIGAMDFAGAVWTAWELRQASPRA